MDTWLKVLMARMDVTEMLIRKIAPVMATGPNWAQLVKTATVRSTMRKCLRRIEHLKSSSKLKSQSSSSISMWPSFSLRRKRRKKSRTLAEAAVRILYTNRLLSSLKEAS